MQMDDENEEIAIPDYRTIENCEIKVPGPCCLILFGASGDLAQRKILPSLYRLMYNRLLPPEFFILGSARTPLTDRQFRGLMKEAVAAAFPGTIDEGLWERLAEKLYYIQADYSSFSSFVSLKDRIASLEKVHRTAGNRILYLAIPPDAYETVIAHLGPAGLSGEDEGYAHVVIEKPIGRDLASAQGLNGVLRSVFRERQVYRMDHYLAKETVQNVLMFRFANSIFEPLWDRRYIDHVQITVSETVGVEHRAGYYERAGVIRDMFQNHLFQLLALTAMEPPAAFEAERVRDEKSKVFRSVRPLSPDALEATVVLGQYAGGTVGGNPVVGYREEPGIPPDSVVPTYAAMKVCIDNWRWHGVPFYLRSGKRLAARKAEIAIQFRPVPHLMFMPHITEAISPNALVLRIQPEEGVSIFFQAKKQGSRVCLDPVEMNFTYQKTVNLDAYERILLDCMEGDQMLFVREDAVEITWSLLTPLLERIGQPAGQGSFPDYAAGSSGPAAADLLINRDGRQWRPL